MTKTRFTSPVMRFVQGDLDEPQTKDAQGNLRTVKTGPNAGQPNPQYFIAAAIAKTDPAWPAFWRVLVTEAVQSFSNLFPHGAQAIEAIVQAGGPTLIPQGWCLHPQFAFKVIDGDGLDSNGKSNATKEGFAGHYVVRFASSYPPRLFYAGRYAPHEQIQEKGAIKRGYYVRVNGTVEGNANAQRPGLYVNLDMVELSAYGPEIVSGPDANEAFSGGPGALPQGASPTPITPPAAAAPPTPGAPAAPLPAAAPPPAGATGYPAAGLPAPASPPPPAAAPQSYTGYMAPPPAGPTPAPAAGPLPPATTTPPLPTVPGGSAHVMLPAANGATYEACIAAGWTDETLRAHGMMQ